MGSQGHYQPLSDQHDGATFRLLRLEPGVKGTEIVCHLHEEQIPDQDNLPLYDAVSYAWGPPYPTHKIRLGAWLVDVRASLYCFLQQIRRPDESLTLWIDALCIDQSNISERSVQVQVMDKIYRCARQSIVWLGTGDGDTAVAMDMIRDRNRSPTGEADFSEEEHKALLAWSWRPYWTRTWVVQEFLLARDIMILCGDERLQWSNISDFALCASSGDIAEWAGFRASPAYRLISQKILSHRPRLSLDGLLIENQHTECQDPRDRVYAMLGLATGDMFGGSIVPAYDKSEFQLLFEVVAHCRISSRNLPRYVRFLTAALKVRWEQAPLHRHLPARTAWDVTGFTVGHVVACEAVHPGRSASQTGLTESLQRALRKTRLYRSDTTKARIVLSALAGMNLAHLQSVHEAWLQASYRSNTHPRARIPLLLVEVLTSNCTPTELVLGLACGTVLQGDHVKYFLGHEVGLVTAVAPENTDVKRERNATLICLRTSEDAASLDPATRQPSSHWVVQTEADLLDDGRLFHCSLNGAQLSVFR